MYIHDTPPSDYLCLKKARKEGVLTAIACAHFDLLLLLSRLGIGIVLAILTAVAHVPAPMDRHRAPLIEDDAG